MVNRLLIYRNDSDAMNIIQHNVKNKMCVLDKSVQETIQTGFKERKVYVFNFDTASKNEYINKFIHEFINKNVKICTNIMDFYFCPEIFSVISDLLRDPNINQEDIWNGIELVKMVTNNCFVAYYYLLGLRDHVDYLNLIESKINQETITDLFNTFQLYDVFKNHNDTTYNKHVHDEIYYTIVQDLFFLKVDSVDKFNHLYNNKWITNNYYVLALIKKYICKNQYDVNEFVRKMNYLIRKGYKPEIAVTLILNKINNRSIMDYKIPNDISIDYIEVIIKLYEIYNIDIREYYNIHKYDISAIKTIHHFLYSESNVVNDAFDRIISRENFIKLLNPSNFINIRSISTLFKNINNIGWNVKIYKGINEMMSANIDITVISDVFDMIINSGIYSKYYSVVAESWMNQNILFYDNLIKMIKRQTNIGLMDIIALCEYIINMDEFNYIKYSEYLKSIAHPTC